MTINKQIIFTFFLLISSILFFGMTDIDILLQDNFFDYSTHTWILDRDLEPYKFIFYDGIKKVLIFIAFSFIIILIFFRKNKIIKEYKKGIVIVVLSAIFVPISTGIIKKNTNMPCPKNELHYGGKMMKTSVWQRYKEPYKSMDRIACYPAGHASGGFALLSLFFLFKTKQNKILALVFPLIIGWSMGIYKMIIGDHFLSHTIITMVIAWLIILIIIKSIRTSRLVD